jgi:hypothetical protein
MLAERNLQLEAAGRVGLSAATSMIPRPRMQISAAMRRSTVFPSNDRDTYGEWRAHVHPEDVEGSPRDCRCSGAKRTKSDEESTKSIYYSSGW